MKWLDKLTHAEKRIAYVKSSAVAEHPHSTWEALYAALPHEERPDFNLIDRWAFTGFTTCSQL